MLAAGAREAEESGAPAAVSRAAGAHRRDARRSTITFAGLAAAVDDFDRLLSGELEPAAESDRGAAQLLEQTRFLSAAFRAYEARLAGRQCRRRARRARANRRKRRRHADAATGRRDRRSPVRSGRLLARRCDAAHDGRRPRRDRHRRDRQRARCRDISIGCGWRSSRST